MKMQFYIFFIIFLLTALGNSKAQRKVEKDCFTHNYLKHTSPDSVGYDDIVSAFHATLMWAEKGLLFGWGENLSPIHAENILVPTKINSRNGFCYEGKPLKIAAGSRGIHSGQYALLTTRRLYIWGKQGNLVSRTLKADNKFLGLTVEGENDGLPANVKPEDVKMLFGSYLTLVVVTYSGQVWVLSGVGQKGGNGRNKNQSEQWIRVLVAPGTPLTNVIAVRGTPFTLMALTDSGTLYTWGMNTYLGDGKPSQNRLWATRMVLPKDRHPKMIGMTSDNLRPSYYLLMRNGQLFTLGFNSKKQMGTWNTYEQRSWQQPILPDSSGKESSTPFNDVAWISPNEHDGSGFPAINILTKEGKLYAWGWNHRNMIGGRIENKAYNPMFMPGSLNPKGVVKAVETGGHTTLIFMKNRKGYGYVGHKISGSMGDGTNTERIDNKYLFMEEKKFTHCDSSQR